MNERDPYWADPENMSETEWKRLDDDDAYRDDREDAAREWSEGPR